MFPVGRLQPASQPALARHAHRQRPAGKTTTTAAAAAATTTATTAAKKKDLLGGVACGALG